MMSKMKGPMDPLAADLASGKIKIGAGEEISEAADKKKKVKADKKPAVLPDKQRLALLMKKHVDQSRMMNRAAQEAQALARHHRSRGEHELAGINKQMVEPFQKAATLHKKLSGLYSKRHGGE